MPTTYTWTATSLVGYPVIDGETGVVITVNYTVVADDGASHIASLDSTQRTPIDPAVPFIPYADLTNEIVIGWVQSNLGVDGVAAICNNLDAQIELQINPPLYPESLPLPWVPAPTPPEPTPEIPVTL